jgi:hypothetical protein
MNADSVNSASELYEDFGMLASVLNAILSHRPVPFEAKHLL